MAKEKEVKSLRAFRIYTVEARQITGSYLVRPPNKMTKTEFKKYMKLYLSGHKRNSVWESVK